MADVPTEPPTTAFPSATRAVPRGTLVIAASGGVRWQTVVAGLLCFIAVLGLVAYLGANQALVWESIAERPRWGAYVNAVLAGLLCAGIARLVPRSAGRRFAVVVGVTGFVAGGLVSGLVLMDLYEGMGNADVSLLFPALIMFLVLLAGVVAVAAKVVKKRS